MTTDLVAYDKTTQKELCQLLGLEGTAQHITLLFKLAEHYGLDVLTKEITLIPKKGPFIGVWGRLHIAQRSGRLDGLELDDEWETDRHYCVRVIVWRKDMRHPAAKVIGRVGKDEGSTDKHTGEFTPKPWPFEIARARGLRAALGYAFSIHDTYDETDADDWEPAPDERFTASPTLREEATGTTTRACTIDMGTGEVLEDDAPQQSPGAAGGQPEPAGPPAAPAPGAEPPTLLVGGHSLAQKIAIAARHAGIEEDTDRHDVIRAATRGAYQRGSDIPEGADPDLINRVLDAFAGLADGTLYLRYDEDGHPRLFKRKQ